MDLWKMSKMSWKRWGMKILYTVLKLSFERQESRMETLLNTMELGGGSIGLCGCLSAAGHFWTTQDRGKDECSYAQSPWLRLEWHHVAPVVSGKLLECPVGAVTEPTPQCHWTSVQPEGIWEPLFGRITQIAMSCRACIIFKKMWG